MDKLWQLIQDQADVIARCHNFLESDFAQTVEAEPLVATVARIISSERDHIEALRYLYDAAVKTKPAADMTEFARQALGDYRERNKLIK